MSVDENGARYENARQSITDQAVQAHTAHMELTGTHEAPQGDAKLRLTPDREHAHPSLSRRPSSVRISLPTPHHSTELLLRRILFSHPLTSDSSHFHLLHRSLNAIPSSPSSSLPNLLLPLHPPTPLLHLRRPRPKMDRPLPQPARPLQPEPLREHPQEELLAHALGEARVALEPDGRARAEGDDGRGEEGVCGEGMAGDGSSKRSAFGRGSRDGDWWEMGAYSVLLYRGRR